jgi:hypothetical protein
VNAPVTPTRVAITRDEAAQILGIHPETFRRRWLDGTLPAAGVRQANRLTKRVYYDRASVEAAMWKVTR